MPVPIRPINDKPNNPESTNIDYSFLAGIPGMSIDAPVTSSKKKVFASNKDAELLFKMWSLAKKNDDRTLNVTDKFSSQEVMRLKVRGFVSGISESLAFTEKGKKVIKTMALGETSKFLKNQESKSYSEILASMDKRNKGGYRIPKMAHNCYANIDLTKIQKKGE